MTEAYQPALHKPIPMQTLVKIPKYYHGKPYDIVGMVVGVAMVHVIFTYIVLLNTEIETPWGNVNAVIVPGAELESPDGKTNWRLEV